MCRKINLIRMILIVVIGIQLQLHTVATQYVIKLHSLLIT